MFSNHRAQDSLERENKKRKDSDDEVLMTNVFRPSTSNSQSSRTSQNKARPGVINCMPNLRMKENCGGTSERNRMKSSINALSWIEKSKQLWREKLKNSPNWRNCGP